MVKLDDMISGKAAVDHDREDAETELAVLTLSEIARQLRELADYASELTERPVFDKTLH